MYLGENGKYYACVCSSLRSGYRHFFRTEPFESGVAAEHFEQYNFPKTRQRCHSEKDCNKGFSDLTHLQLVEKIAHEGMSLDW